MIKKAFSQLRSQRDHARRAELQRNLIRHEAKIGGQLFGPVPKGVRREFFCLDEHSWVWHEEYAGTSGKRRTQTVRYDIRPTGILKSQDGQAYRQVGPQEAKNLYHATHNYYQRIRKDIYSAVA